MGLLERVQAERRTPRPRARKGWSQPPFWDLDRLRYPMLGSSSLNSKREEIENDFEGYVQGILKRSGPAAALMFVRLFHFSEARFTFQRIRQGRPGDLFGTKALSVLEAPWPNGTTGDLLARMSLDIDLAGNSYFTLVSGHLRRLRPDWVTIISASESEPELYGAALDAEIIGYLYSPRVKGVDLVAGRPAPGTTLLLPSQVAHFAPIPDPLFNWRGMSWLTPALREISADSAATVHKLKFFENGASPQMVVTLDASVKREDFERFKAAMDAGHAGAANAYKTLYLGGGADVTVVGKDLQQLDFKATQGAGESRLAALAGVPATLVGFSEGLAGSSLNAGNYASARRRFADGTIRPMWRQAAGALATLVDVPADARLWWDERDIAFLREDRKDAAEIAFRRAQTIRTLVDSGFKPASVVAAVEAEDYSLLEHSGLYSVQLQPPQDPSALPPAGQPPALPAPADDPGGDPADPEGADPDELAA
ncbi:phage portal protein [Actinomadura formosensis]|uniref:phage portal protein n=1 Tax=Actinomadura formosensis TaxID=60706 RepID=UPI003D8A9AE3